MTTRSSTWPLRHAPATALAISLACSTALAGSAFGQTPPAWQTDGVRADA